MPTVVTLTSDFGTSDEYLAQVKGTLFSVSPDIPIIDLNHNIEPYHIMEGARVIQESYATFPQGSIHVIAVHTHYQHKVQWLVHKHQNHWFVVPDNGLLSLLFSDIDSTAMAEGENWKTGLAAAVVSIVNDTVSRLSSLAIRRYLLPAVRANKRSIMGTVTHIDHYGNAITNIDRHTFTALTENKTIRIRFGHEVTERIHEGYSSVEPGECYLFFNSGGWLQIGINMGHGAELLGLKRESPVTIQIEE